MGGEGLVGKFSPPFVSRKNMSFFFPVRFEVPQPPMTPFSPPTGGSNFGLQVVFVISYFCI